MLTQPAENFTCFESLAEPRRTSGNFQHELIDIVVLSVCATICYCETWDEIEDFGNERIGWLKKYLSLPKGIPGHDTTASCHGLIRLSFSSAFKHGSIDFSWTCAAKGFISTAKRCATVSTTTPILRRCTWSCLLYTSPSPRDQRGSRMPSSA